MSRISLVSLLVANLATASPCCLESASRSFVGLLPHQTLEVALSAEISDRFGRFDDGGTLAAADPDRRFQLALGAGWRPLSELELAIQIPWTSSLSGNDASSLGNLTFAARFGLTKDWWVGAGMVAPTSASNSFSEPHLATGVTWSWGVLRAELQATWLRRFARETATTRFEILESLTLDLSERWSLSGGSTQTKQFFSQQDGYSIRLFLAPSIRIDSQWAVTLLVDSTVASHDFGKNSPATQLASLTLRRLIF